MIWVNSCNTTHRKDAFHGNGGLAAVTVCDKLGKEAVCYCTEIVGKVAVSWTEVEILMDRKVDGTDP